VSEHESAVADARAALDDYARAVGELRGLTLDARARIEQAETVRDEVREFLRRRDKRAARSAAHRPGRDQVE
jgi:hypothetical protein